VIGAEPGLISQSIFGIALIAFGRPRLARQNARQLESVTVLRTKTEAQEKVLYFKDLWPGGPIPGRDLGEGKHSGENSGRGKKHAALFLRPRRA